MQKPASNQPSSRLLDLVIDLNWEDAIAHASQYPRDATFQTFDWGETPLYVACQFRPPLRFIKALLKANREATLPQTKNRDTPLHIACRFGASTSIIEALLEANPSSATQLSRWGQSPFSSLFEAPSMDSKIQKEKLNLLLKAAKYGSTSPIINSWHPLHAALELRSKTCPREVISFILKEYPNECFERDENGLLPLHIALLLSSSKTNEYSSVIYELVDLNPSAVLIPFKHDKNDCFFYALHIAVSNDMPWEIVEKIYEAGPHLVDEIDSEARIYPFMMAAVRGNLETTFSLLISKPDFVDGANCYCQEIDDKVYVRKVNSHLDSARVFISILLVVGCMGRVVFF